MSDSDDNRPGDHPEHPPKEGDSDEIVCRPTKWFYRRMGLMALLLIGLGLYFFYDGQYGYPKANQRADVYDWFHNDVLATYQELDESDRLDEWPEVAASGEDPFGNKGWPTGADGGEPRWPNYSADLGWSSDEPRRYSAAEIQEQFRWGIGTSLIGLIVVGYALSQVPTRLRADGESFTPPRGGRICFDQVFKVDTRKWKHKGLAYVHYKKEDGSRSRATIDDLKYGGAQKVLDRLLANFSGELVEKVEEADSASGEGETAQADDAAAGEEASSPAGDKESST